MKNEYECVMGNPPKPTVLKAQKFNLIFQPYLVEGFSIGEDGKEGKNGIEFMVNKLVGIEHVKD